MFNVLRPSMSGGAEAVRWRIGGRVGSVRLGLCLGVLFALNTPMGRALEAQRSTPGESPSNGASAGTDSQRPGDTPYPDILEVAADTGRMIHGWHDFSRYPWVGPLDMCGQAVEFAIGRMWRHAEHDTASIMARTNDTMPPTIPQLAQRCGVLSLLPDAEQQVAEGRGGHAAFWPAYLLTLALHRDVENTALLMGMLAHAHRRTEQGGLLLNVWWADTDMHPLRLDLFERDARLADSLAQLPISADPLLQEDGRSARGIYVAVADKIRWYLVRYWLTRGDTGKARAAVEAFLDTQQRLGISHNSVRQYCFDILNNLTILQHGLRSREMAALLTRETRIQQNDSTARGVVPPWLLYLEKPFIWPETPYWYSAAGAPLPPPASGGTGRPGTTAIPIPTDKVTLIWDPANWDHRLYRANGAESLTMISGMIRKLLARYGPQGLQLVVIAHTRGSVAWLGAVDQEQEAPAIRQFYQEQLGLSATVVVDTVPFRYLPDGRRQDAYTAWERRYILEVVPQWRLFTDPFFWSPMEPFLLDRHGKIRVYGSHWGAGANEDPMLELFIQQLLKEP